MYELRVNAVFSAAHNLRGYEGKCENLHGHTWKVELCASGDTLNNIGMLCDFKELKGKLREVLSMFDHNYINEIKPFDKINPTAENLARFIYESVEKYFNNIKEVVVWESEDAGATYRK
jgi:6-pyruvoyltetrahydropterin/6-carboxytetrahydropterin synthase